LIDATCGWLSYSGEFMPCNSWEHDIWIFENLGLSSNEAEERGWVRLWGVGELPEFSNERSLSQWQRDTMTRMGFNLEWYD
jgi:hypothetical protein